ncbi:MAG TPA: C4-dicarboxylate ABC transporter permease, partial [Pasteurellaceae bacterium]|nr:C4-dicarboxylate ABC transporter permease [Pasteurellaceae bacterium]
FYFGIFANITPPVALAAFAGAGIANGDPMKTGWQSLRLALAGFIVPFMFVYNPSMLMIDVEGLSLMANSFPLPSVWVIISVIITSITGVLGLSSAVEGYFKAPMNTWQRIVLAGGSFMLIVPESITDLVGIIIVGIIIWLNVRQK